MNVLGYLVTLWTRWEARSLEHALNKAAPGPISPILFYGSSSIRLWSTLTADLGRPEIMNLGFGGSTLADCVVYFERLVVPRKPRSLFVYAGDNDLGEGRSVEDVVESFRQLVGKVDAHLGPIPLAFLSIKPSPARWALIDAIQSANALIAAELQSRPNSTFIDIFEPMIGPDGKPKPELYAEDGLHLSQEGYRVWTQVILKQGSALLG